MLGARAVGDGKQHPPEDLLRGEAVLAVGVAVAEDVGLAERRPVVGGRPDVRVGERRDDGGAAIGLVEPELLVGGVEQEVHPRGHISRDREEVAEPARVGGPGDERNLGLDPLEPLLHAPDQVLHAAVGPVLIAAERRVVHVGPGDRGARVLPVALAAVAAIADAAVVQPVEAEGVNGRVHGEDLGQDVDEEVAIRPEQAEHPAVWVFLQVDLGDLGGIRADAPPVRMSLVDLALEAGRIDAQDADAQFAVLGDVLLEPAERDMRAAPLEELAVVVGIERVDEAQLADGHPVRGRGGPGLRNPSPRGYSRSRSSLAPMPGRAPAGTAPRRTAGA